MYKQILFIALLTIIVRQTTEAQEINPYGFIEVSRYEFQDIMMANDQLYLLCDVRPWHYYKKSRIRNAVFINNSQQLKQLCDSLVKDHIIMLYGLYENRAFDAASKLAEWGYTNIYYLKDSFEQFKAEDFPIDEERIRGWQPR